MPGRKPKTKAAKRKEAVELALTMQKLYRHEPALAQMIATAALHSDVVPELLSTARQRIRELQRAAPTQEDLFGDDENALRTSEASDALARAATLSKPFIRGKIGALKRTNLPPGASPAHSLTQILTPAEYKRLWEAGRISWGSGPQGPHTKGMHNYNVPPPEEYAIAKHGLPSSMHRSCTPATYTQWPYNVMTPTNYELHKLDSALKILETGRRGIDGVVEELPDEEDEVGGRAARRTRRRRRPKTKKNAKTGKKAVRGRRTRHTKGSRKRQQTKV